ncbi:hypothetical protein B0I35DRAFT_413672 [Stachybotrys elegans]|uniref:Uncharacterized protein n=1 Tax=Stachybotrys elegans TaxID=80388 RepID=A0A8K0SKS8_9HYPO|nr:hypothetical protein B0I35DRAFT_413672 [Stachybotrys elegans]
MSMANSPFFDVNRTPVPPRGETLKVFDRNFLDAGVWSQLSERDRRNRFMSQIFHLIHMRILNARIFSRFRLSMNNPNQDRDLITEDDLGWFEALLEFNNVDKALVSNWKLATIECATQVANMDSKAMEEVVNQFNELCNLTWELRMMMRRSKENYRCDVPLPRGGRCLLTDHENAAEPMTVKRGSAKDMSENIAYSLFGYLIREGGRMDSEDVVLEKAQVVLERR